jgi:hypothetical protein
MISRLRIGVVVACFLLAALPIGAGKGEPEKVLVQHILIAFKRSVPNKPLKRTRKEARALAESLYDRAVKGEDFDALVKEYTNDQYPGMMLLTNKGAPQVQGGRTRDDVVPKFGDVSFRLEVDEIGLASHHAALSPYGWHVIKRLE